MDEPRPLTASACLDLLDRLLTTMIDQQEHKLLHMAREFVPDLTPEDLRNPQDFAVLVRNP